MLYNTQSVELKGQSRATTGMIVNTEYRCGGK